MIFSATQKVKQNQLINKARTPNWGWRRWRMRIKIPFHNFNVHCVVNEHSKTHFEASSFIGSLRIKNVSFFIFFEAKIYQESATKYNSIVSLTFVFLLRSIHVEWTKLLSSDWDTIPETFILLMCFFFSFSSKFQDTLNENRIIDKLMFPFRFAMSRETFAKAIIKNKISETMRKVQNTKEIVNCFSLCRC